MRFLIVSYEIYLFGGIDIISKNLNSSTVLG